MGEQHGSGAKGNHLPEEGHENDSVHPYFQEVGRFSLLTREEEIQIAKRIEIGQKKGHLSTGNWLFGVPRKWGEPRNHSFEQNLERNLYNIIRENWAGNFRILGSRV